MAKKDDEAPPVCGICLGAGGEWIDRNGDSNKQSVWVSCKTCDGTGRA